MGGSRYMAMQEIIEAMKQDDFSKYMNAPEPGRENMAYTKIFPDLSEWVVCPFCRKKAIKILPDTKIHNMPYKCKGSKCKKEFLVNVE